MCIFVAALRQSLRDPIDGPAAAADITDVFRAR